MKKNAIRRGNQTIIRSLVDLYDYLSSCDGVKQVIPVGMSDRRSRETIAEIKTYDPVRGIKVEAHSRDGYQVFMVKVDKEKASAVRKCIEAYKLK